jgi:hypothetical protein
MKSGDYRRQLQSMRSWCNENFESEEARVVVWTLADFVCLSPPDAGGGELCFLFAISIGLAFINMHAAQYVWMLIIPAQMFFKKKDSHKLISSLSIVINL